MAPLKLETAMRALRGSCFDTTVLLLSEFVNSSEPSYCQHQSRESKTSVLLLGGLCGRGFHCALSCFRNDVSDLLRFLQHCDVASRKFHGYTASSLRGVFF